VPRYSDSGTHAVSTEPLESWRAFFQGKTLEVTLSLAPDDRLSWFLVKAIDE
jgi:hypothetical protein